MVERGGCRQLLSAGEHLWCESARSALEELLEGALKAPRVAEHSARQALAICRTFSSMKKVHELSEDLYVRGVKVVCDLLHEKGVSGLTTW